MRILLVDDDASGREAAAYFLEKQLGHSVKECKDGKEALEVFKKEPFPFVLTDWKMPHKDGLGLLNEIKSSIQGDQTDVVIMTGYADIDSVIAALRGMAMDYLQKPLRVHKLAEVVKKAEKRYKRRLNSNGGAQVQDAETEDNPQAVRGKNDLFERAVMNVPGAGNVGIVSRAMYEIVKKSLQFHEDRTLPVLIEGETGTGKEVVAKLIHHGESGSKLPFISINCSAIPRELFESELFGYVEGAFTGASKKGSGGKLKMAEGGTLFLDDIIEMPLELQSKLLRLLQEKEYYRVGGEKLFTADVRFIASANRKVQDVVKEGNFRQDLYYRLNIGRIQIPPLSEQIESIPALAQIIMRKISDEKGRRFRTISKGAVDLLKKHKWEGNIRELENTIERAIQLNDGFELRPDHFEYLMKEYEELAPSTAGALKLGEIELPENGLDFKELEAEIINKALKLNDGNKTAAAEYLGLTRSEYLTKLKNAQTVV